METKGKILRILANNSEYISGEAVSRSICISRAAVSQAVKSLREEGYVIGSVTNRGYRLEYLPDHLTSASLGIYLEEERMENVEVYKTIDSTSNELMKRAMGNIPDRSVIIADAQTSGRGRRGRSFDSPGGKGVYLSYYFKPSEELKNEIYKTGDSLIWASITSWTAVAISDAMEETCGTMPGIKWVNDLYMNGRKLGGIITQMITSAENNEVEGIVIGIGINVRQSMEDFPEDIRGVAGSIFTETGKKIERARLAASMVTAMDKLRASWPCARDLYHKKYVERSIVIDKDVTLSSAAGVCEARVMGIDNDFALTVRTSDGQERRIISGEVTLRFR